MKKSILIEERLHKDLKIFCAQCGFKIRDWVEQSLRENMEKVNELQKNSRSNNIQRQK